MNITLRQTSRIVVVDPFPDDYLSLAALAENNDVGWSTFRSASELLEESLPRGVLCWIVNVDLPDSSGPELGQLLPRRGKSGPIVLVSERYSPQTERDVLASGLGLYACKPIAPNWFRQVIPWPVRRRAAPRQPVMAGSDRGG